MSRQWRALRAFGSAFLLTLCGILLAGGLLLSDLNSRRITFGDSTPPYAASGGDRVRDCLQNQTAASFLPAHLQPFAWLWEGEQWLMEQLLDR